MSTFNRTDQSVAGALELAMVEEVEVSWVPEMFRLTCLMNEILLPSHYFFGSQLHDNIGGKVFAFRPEDIEVIPMLEAVENGLESTK